MLGGPIFGSFLYKLGGFEMPFYVTGVLLFILIIPIKIIFDEDNKRENNDHFIKNSEGQITDTIINDSNEQ